MDNRHILFGLRLVAFIAVSLVVLCFYALAVGKSLEPVSMIVTSLVGLLSGLAGYFWGSSHKGNGTTTVVLAIGLLLLPSCAVKKRSVNEVISAASVARIDSSRADSSALHSSASLLESYSSTTARDTVIGVAAADVSARFFPESLDTSDVYVRHRTTSITATRNRDGSINVRCKQDSLTIVIARLVRDSVSRQAYIRQLTAMYSFQSYNGKDSTGNVSSKKSVATKSGGFAWVVVFAFGFVVGAGVWRILMTFKNTLLL